MTKRWAFVDLFTCQSLDTGRYVYCGREAPAQWDSRRMAETGTGSGRSPTSPVGNADAPNLPQDHSGDKL